MYKKIIVPVDCGQLDKGEKILRQAGALIDPAGEIVLITVVEDMPAYLAIDVPIGLIEDAIEDGKTRLTELKTKTGIATRIEIRTGSPAREILAVANEAGADLIIVASHVPDFANYFIGATADRVVRHSKISVLVDR